MPSSPESETNEREATQREPRPPEGNGRDEQDELRAELAELEDRYKRALADLDNYRKRTAREFERQRLEARAAALLEWLDSVDSVERAIRLDPNGSCAEGLRAILDQMQSVLARQGATRIGAPGDRFDPELHEAVAVQEANGVPDRTIVSVERSGYALGDRVIRPAQVVVARSAAPAR